MTFTRFVLHVWNPSIDSFDMESALIHDIRLASGRAIDTDLRNQWAKPVRRAERPATARSHFIMHGACPFGYAQAVADSSAGNIT